MYFSMFSTTPPESSHSYQRIYLHHNLSTVYHYSLILARAGRTFRATPSGPRESPELPSQAPGNPYTTPSSLPWYFRAHGLSTTQKGRVSPFTREGLSLLPKVVRRHQHLPLGRQPRSPERSTRFSLSI